ncbi:MAG: serine hydrolase [Bacteroidales bacterium]|nr:serine hydrolase [Bacteroidales bacterium]
MAVVFVKSVFRHFSIFILICVSAAGYSQTRDYWPTQGWQNKSPEEAGINASSLEDMEQIISSSMPYVDAFLIVKNGYLVYENYFDSGYDRNDIHILCSATKSITSILIGILLKQQYIDHLDQKIKDFFPEYSNVNIDPRFDLLTIEHMLSFTSGLAMDDDGNWQTEDMISTFLSSEFVADPGTQFNYATSASQVLSGIISKTTGKNARDFATTELFQKLGITNFSWLTDGLGYTYGGFRSYFEPVDMLKIGYLYLNHGIWNGDTIVDPGYVLTSTIAHTDGGGPHHEKYGYNWWITENNGYNAFFAGGYGGQFIYVVPELDLVVAITCKIDRHREDARFLVNSHVVPAILNFSTPTKDINSAATELKTFPNPVKETLYVILETKSHTKASLFITDLSGRVVAELLNTVNLPPGQHKYTYKPGLTEGCYIITGVLGIKKYHAGICILNR